MTHTLRFSLVAVLCMAPLVAAAPESPVAEAAMRGELEAVRLLIKQKSDVNVARADGMTALHWAARRGDVAMTQALIDAGAHVEAQTRLGAYTPLHVAANGGHAAVVRALLGAAANAKAATASH